MEPSLDEFRARLIDSGALEETALRQFEAELADDERPASSDDLARLLVKRNRLTKYQAAHLYQGVESPLVCGNYVITDKIGFGGMGKVYKAEHRRLKRPAAIKLLPVKATESRAAVRRFYREVKAAARLKHPHIVLTYDAGDERGVPYFVMEYVDGPDLATYIQNQGPLSPELAIECVRQAASGLAYAHAEGVIHCDIKPANLLITWDGEGDSARPVVKVLDMGLAHLLAASEADDGSSSALGRQIVGSVDYISPEQADVRQTVDARSDVYSLGCTLYVMLTARAPYSVKGALQKVQAHRESPVPDVRHRRPEIPDALAEA
ncbi:MAG: serine/threonine protein kinase, partial [Planctomycetales bacterium]|nr:serine/threonine protein kinase [Planctomycetales bacterium]